MKTISLSADRFGSGSFGTKASRGWKPKPPRADKVAPHPIFGRHRLLSKRALHAEDLERKQWKRSLDRKYAKAATEKAAEDSAKFKKRWSKHLAAQSVSRGFQW